MAGDRRRADGELPSTGIPADQHHSSGSPDSPHLDIQSGTAPPDGHLSPRAYEVAQPHASAEGARPGAYGRTPAQPGGSAIPTSAAGARPLPDDGAMRVHDDALHGGTAAGLYLDDAALVERAKTDPEAFGVLYERYVRSVFGFAFSKLHDRALAEDITSQTFLQALRALPRYQQRGAPIRSWFFRISANLIADLHRAPLTEQPMQLRPGAASSGDREEQAAGVHGTSLFDPPDPAAEAAIAAWESAEDFLRMIEDLTPEQRTVMRLRFADGLSIAEIAAHMARSEGAVKMLMLRGLQQLRRRLDVGARGSMPVGAPSHRPQAAGRPQPACGALPVADEAGALPVADEAGEPPS